MKRIIWLSITILILALVVSSQTTTTKPDEDPLKGLSEMDLTADRIYVEAKAGDTVKILAARHGADPVAVAKNNGLLPDTILGAGRKIWIPKASDGTVARSPLMAKVMEVELLARLCSLSPSQAKCIDRRPSLELTELYTQIIRNKKESQALIARAAETDLAKMQLILVVQNQRIIELLEELKKQP